MEMAIKMEKSNLDKMLRILVAIAIAVLFAASLSACAKREEALAPEAPSAMPPGAAAPEVGAPAPDAAAPAPESAAPAPAPGNTTPRNGKAPERSEVARKAVDTNEPVAQLETRKAKSQRQLSVPDQQMVMAMRKEHVDQKAVQGSGKNGEDVSHDAKKSIEMAPAPEPKKSNLEDYSVTVSANEQLAIPGPPGELRVWIGVSSKAPRIQPGMITETKELEAVGETAKVTPFTLGIDVEPKVSICEKIDPSGSEVRFKLIPRKSGVFTVGANVELYDSKDCSGPPVPKSTKSVEVKVSVDKAGVITNAVTELAVAAWKAFLDFWDKVLLLIFALILFLIRKKLFKLFGFKDKE